jgi:ubiquinone/menaquinone biosynthesis C-methylase UbiE
MPLSKQVNYDPIAPGYDQRVQGTYLVGVTSALQSLARKVRARHILDLGCGTGRSLQGMANSPHPVPTLYGLDFSAGMLKKARSLDAAYRLVQASALYPPFARNSFDLIFCTHAFHHFADKPRVVRAAYALLRPGGAFAIVNFDPRESGKHHWPIYEYFEETYETDLERFPAVAEQEAILQQANFQQVSSPVVQYIESRLVDEAIFDSYHIRKEACSQLILLSVEAYEAGLERMRARIAAARANGESVIFQTHLKNRMCHGFKPG